MKKFIRNSAALFAFLTIATCFFPMVYAQESAEETVRTIFADDFSANDGIKWNAKTANADTSIDFSDGMVNVAGSGPENRISAKPLIGADNFTINLDLWLHMGNTNAAIKFVFKSDATFKNRYQITFDVINRRLSLEKVTGGTVTKLHTQNEFELPVNTGADPYHLQIDVQDHTVTVTIDGVQKLSAQDDGLSVAAPGYFAIASQFPNQQYSIDNVEITTNQPEKYVVTLKTMTNGTIDTQEATAGGTLTADKLAGADGETITLTPAAKEGFVLHGYSSLLTDTGNSTDGLLTITDNQFQLSDKTGNVTIIAQFKAIPKDPNLLFSDTFSGTLNEKGQYSKIRFPDSAHIENGALQLSADEGVNYLLAATDSWSFLAGEGYRIAFDVSKANTTDGTLQVAFRAGSFSDRYVLALNGSLATICRLDSAGNKHELAGTQYTLDTTPRRIVITVLGDTVSVTSDDRPVISYRNATSAEDHEGWSDVPVGLALINMTADAPVVYDNVTATKFSAKIPVKIIVTNNGAPDPAFRSGVAHAQPTTAAPGEEVTLTALPKAGYRLEGYDLSGSKIDGDTFLIPENAGAQGVTVTANFVKDDTMRQPLVFYVDAQGGNDSNSGTDKFAPWKTLQKAAQQQLIPGDRLLIKADSRFEGEAACLTLIGSGTAEAPITVSSYGAGRRPCLNGLGQVENVISLYNQEYITIDGLEITNLHPDFQSTFALNSSNNKSTALRAVNVSAKNFGVVHGIELKNLYIHDVNGNLSSKWNGGIFFDVQADIVNGSLTGIPTKYDNILIEDCKLERVDRSAIKLVNSAWANQSSANNPNVPLNWYPSTNIVVRGNVISYIGGDGITVRDSDGALIEYNLVSDCRYQNTGYNAGIWPFQATNTVIQYNEVARTRGTQDGQGLDCDHISAYTVMQYNYSHDNQGGFMLIMNGFPHVAPTIRYNLSQNDKDKTFEFSRGTPAGTMIYNNTIYSDSLLTGRGGVFDLANSAAGTGNREVYVFNNLFYYPAGQPFYCGESNNMKSKIQLYNNAYYGGIAVPAQEQQAITQDPMLAAVGSAPSINNGTTPVAGKYITNQLDGYRPMAGSSLINQAVTPDELLAYYKGTATDHRSLSPTDLFALSSKGRSIDFTAAGYLPAVQGVMYDKDVLGNPLVWGSRKNTIGAIQYDSSK